MVLKIHACNQGIATECAKGLFSYKAILKGDANPKLYLQLFDETNPIVWLRCLGWLWAQQKGL